MEEDNNNNKPDETAAIGSVEIETDATDDISSSSTSSEFNNETPTNTAEEEEETEAVEEEEEEETRTGTISSARLNILSTMVGGGCLSLPLAFQEASSTSNLLLGGPVLLMIVAALIDFSIRCLITAGTHHHHDGTTTSTSTSTSSSERKKGRASLEQTAQNAFGAKTKYGCMVLVFVMCWLAVVAYAVLLRDLLEPVSDFLFRHESSSDTGPTLDRNVMMLFVVLMISPLCTLPNLTSLRNVGAASMTAVGTLGLCISIRSIQCNYQKGDWMEYLLSSHGSSSSSIAGILNSVPIFISCYVCHYNILPVHNELKHPTKRRVSKFVSSTIWSCAFVFYVLMGLLGSMYGNCTTEKVGGNVLLAFPEDDLLVLLGRSCLALTVTLAFPMIVIPARESLLEGWICWHNWKDARRRRRRGVGDLEEPLLVLDDDEEDGVEHDAPAAPMTHSKMTRSITAILIFWSAAALGCMVKSIDIIWDLMGSSFSIILVFLIPCGSYMVLMKHLGGKRLLLAKVLVVLSFPLMIVCTGNAIYNTFFHL